MNRLLLLFLLASTLVPATLADCNCKHPPRSQTTRWGGNQSIILKEESPLKQLQGIVKRPGVEPTYRVLIEIFTEPDYLLQNPQPSEKERPKQVRLAACETTADGKFCFRGLRSGKYEVRASSGPGIDVTHVFVILDQRSGIVKRMEVPIVLGN